MNKIFKKLQIPSEYSTKYWEEIVSLRARFAKVTAIIGVVLVPCSILFDYLILGVENMAYFVVVRIITTVLLSTCLYFSFQKKYEIYGNKIIMAVLIIIGLGISAIIRKIGYEHSYYAALNLIYLGVIVTPLGLVETLTTCGLIFSFYIIPVFLFDVQKINISVFSNNAGFQLETIIIAVVFSYFNMERIKRDILSRLMISKQASEIEQKSHELAKSYEDLKNSEEVKKEFVSNITHDIKTPLSVVLGHTELLMSDIEPGGAIWKSAKFINRSAAQLNQLVDKMISTALLDREDKLNMETYDYTTFIKSAFAMFQANAVKHEIHFKLEVNEDKIVVQVDNAWMERVFGNLIQNAFKFTKPGGTISVKVYKDAEYVYTEVSDTGVGIPEEKIGRIFERKYQAHEDKEHKGFGLGLSIVKETLQRFDGSITVSSIVGEGSTFKYKLPLFVDQNAKVRNEPYTGGERRGKERRGVGAASDRRSGYDRREEERLKSMRQEVENQIEDDVLSIDLDSYENKTPSKPTVLIVEDTPAQINLVIESLKGDYNLLFAKNGIQALEKLDTFKEKISLILSDVKMPEMDGLEFCAKVFESDKYKHIPFIFITAYANVEEEFKGLRLGATDYITKPMNTHILKEKIHQWIARRQNEIVLQDVCGTLENKIVEVSKIKAVVEHEVGHPLSLLMGADYYFNKLYEKYYQDSQDKELWDVLKSIKAAVESIKSVIDVSKKLERSELGRIQSEEIRSIINDAVFQNTYIIEQNNISVSIPDENEKYFIMCDRNLISQVLKNLIRNAVESITEKKSDGAGKINIRFEKAENNRVHVVLLDNGNGMSEDVLKKLFQFKFTTKKSGTGIGLYLSMLIIKMHGGYIDVQSKEEIGTKFTIALPLCAENGVAVNR